MQTYRRTKMNTSSFEKNFISSIEILVSCSKYNNKACLILGTMDGTVNEGILLHEGQEKRKTLWYQQMRGNMSIYF